MAREIQLVAAQLTTPEHTTQRTETIENSKIAFYKTDHVMFHVTFHACDIPCPPPSMFAWDMQSQQAPKLSGFFGAASPSIFRNI